MASSNVESKEDAETDSSGSDYDNVDFGVKTAKRKILKVLKKILPSDESGKYKPQTEKLYNSKSSNSYDFNHEKRGCCVIINNDKFTNMDSRPGSDKDVRNLETEFKNLEFDVKIYNNLTANYIDKKLRKVSMKYDHEKADCFVCILLSHGDEHFDLKRERNDVIFGSDGSFITVADIMENFSDTYCPGLLGKPRLFFIQACRGSRTEKGVDITIKYTKKVEVPVNAQKPIERKFIYGNQYGEGSEAAVDAKPGKVLDDIGRMTIDSDDEEDFLKYKKGLDSLKTTPSPCYTDSLVMFASPPGFFAFRRESGTWFIKSLTYVLQNSSRSKTFQQMLTQVSYEMAMNYKSKNKKNPNISGCVTIPCVMSMLTKDIYFHSKKK